MTNQQILAKAIQKAKDGGWEEYGTMYFSFDSDPEGFISELIDGTHDAVPTLNCVIFSHGFAKAIWGEEYIPDQLYSTTLLPEFKEWHTANPAWQVHLMRMVIAEDPIKYLGENL